MAHLILASSFLSPPALHIPDGFLSLPVAIVGWLLAAVIVRWALRRTGEHLGERQVPLMGVLAAFIFAAQMLNFPVAGGTSGHLLGGALAAILMGPWTATLIMTCVVAVQALVFQDGGLLALGWNTLNMGVLTAFTGYFVYRGARRAFGASQAGSVGAGLAAGWLSVMVGAAATAVELAASGTSPLSVAPPAMAGVHALIGIGEGLITASALALIGRSRPDLLQAGASSTAGRPAAARSAAALWVVLLLALLLVAISPLASDRPDGLEWVAKQEGFGDRALDPSYEVLPDYSAPFVENQTASTILAGVLGVLVVTGAAYVVGQMRRRRERTQG